MIRLGLAFQIFELPSKLKFLGKIKNVMIPSLVKHVQDVCFFYLFKTLVGV